MTHNPHQHQNEMMNPVTNPNQRGLASNSMYEIQPATMNHLSSMHQSQIGGFSASSSANLSQNLSDLSSQFSNMLNINGNGYSSAGGSSLHSDLNKDQLNMNHHSLGQQFSPPQHHQPSLSQHYPQHSLSNHHHHSQQRQSQQTQHQPPQIQHQPQQTLQHQSQHQQSPSCQMTQQSSLYNFQGGHTQSAMSQQSQMKPVSLKQQQRQSYTHIQQRHSHQPVTRFEVTQPVRILQNSNSVNRRSLEKDAGAANSISACGMNGNVTELNKSVELEDAAVTPDATEEEVDDISKENCNETSTEDKNTSEITEQSDNASETKDLANTKEKTPLTLVREIAKFNKIECKYNLLDEQGPAHKKTFFVDLLLGTEKYSSSGPSIKKAQQAAAATAVKETEYKPPKTKVWKPGKQRRPFGTEPLTPTVELNALATKRGETTEYKAIEPKQPPYYYPAGMDPRAYYGQRYYHYMRAGRDPRYMGGYWPVRCHYPRMSRVFYVALRVGHREFIGDGPTRQAARHSAAMKALRLLNRLPQKDNPEAEPDPLEKDIDDENLDKSKISLVHEIAFRRKMDISFELLRDRGPPHKKIYAMKCIVGSFETEGEGNSKKLAKTIAAEEMLTKLKELGPLPQRNVKTRFVQKHRKQDIQQQRADPNYGVGIHPVSRLTQIMCVQKKKGPVFSLVGEKSFATRKEFNIQIEADGKTCVGSGPNKKLAKRSAAEAMIELLGYDRPTPQPSKSSIKQPSESHGVVNGEKKVTFSDSCETDSSTKSHGVQQKVPGIIHLPANTIVSTPGSCTVSSSQSNGNESLVNLSAILKPNWRPELQLRELCKVLNHPVEIYDFTKSQPNGMEYASKICVGSKDNQQSFLRSSSSSAESARDLACMEALKMLVSRVKGMNPGGDGSVPGKKSVLSSHLGSERRNMSQ